LFNTTIDICNLYTDNVKVEDRLEKLKLIEMRVKRSLSKNAACKI